MRDDLMSWRVGVRCDVLRTMWLVTEAQAIASWRWGRLPLPNCWVFVPHEKSMTKRYESLRNSVGQLPAITQRLKLGLGEAVGHIDERLSRAAPSTRVPLGQLTPATVSQQSPCSESHSQILTRKPSVRFIVCVLARFSTSEIHLCSSVAGI